MKADGENRLSGFFEYIPQAGSIVAVAVGIFTLLGWVLDQAVLKSVVPGFPPMKANVAVAMILMGVSLWISSQEAPSRLSRNIAGLCAGMVLLIGLATLGEYLLGMDFGIDLLLVQDVVNFPGDTPGRMSVRVALCLVMIASSLWLLIWNSPTYSKAIQMLSFATVVIAMSGLVSYAYDIGGDHQVRLAFSPVSLHAAATLVLFGLGMLNARAEFIFRRILISDSAVGSSSRRLLPAVIGFPLVTGWLIMQGIQVGQYGESVGMALFAIANVGGLGVVALWNASRLLSAEASKKQAEETLRVSEDRFKYLFEHSPIGKSITSPAGELHVNHAFCEMLGYSMKELMHLSWQDISHPDDIGPTQKELDALLAGTQKSARFTKRYLHKNGSVVLADVSTSLRRDETGRPLYFMTNVMNISERKKAEEALRLEHERLRRFIDSNIVGIVIANAAGDVIEANDYYLRLIDFTRDELEHGKVDWRAITPPEWLQVDEQAILELRERGSCTPYEKEYFRRDGSRVPVLLANALLPGQEQQIAAFVLDITDRKRAEKELRKLNVELEQRVAERTEKLDTALRDLEGFAYSVSHDLRVPLRAIDGFSQQLLKRYSGQLDDEGKRYLKVVRDNTNKMAQLIDDILAFSRMGRLGMSMTEINMESLAREAFEELKPSLAGRELTMQISPLPPCYGDLAMLR